jgi:hypothetical protein
MKDFSLFYGPARGWLSVIALVVVGLMVVLTYPSRVGDGAGPGEAESPIAPAQVETFSTPAPPVEPGGDAPAPSAWEGVERVGRDVPVVSLQPSPEPMTEAGRDLVRQAGRSDP